MKEEDHSGELEGILRGMYSRSNPFPTKQDTPKPNNEIEELKKRIASLESEVAKYKSPQPVQSQPQAQVYHDSYEKYLASLTGSLDRNDYATAKSDFYRLLDNKKWDLIDCAMNHLVEKALTRGDKKAFEFARNMAESLKAYNHPCAASYISDLSHPQVLNFFYNKLESEEPSDEVPEPNSLEGQITGKVKASEPEKKQPEKPRSKPIVSFKAPGEKIAGGIGRLKNTFGSVPDRFNMMLYGSPKVSLENDSLSDLYTKCVKFESECSERINGYAKFSGLKEQYQRKDFSDFIDSTKSELESMLQSFSSIKAELEEINQNPSSADSSQKLRNARTALASQIAAYKAFLINSEDKGTRLKNTVNREAQKKEKKSFWDQLFG